MEPELVVAEGVEQADALGRAEDQIKAGDRPQLPLHHPPLPRRRIELLDVDPTRRDRRSQLGAA